ncbi:unnamed protein product [Urochloa humidicola]
MATANPPVLSLQHPPPDLLRLVDALCASGRAAEAHHRASLFLLHSAASRLYARAADALLRRLLRARAPLLTLRLIQAAALVPSLPNHNRLLALLCRADPPQVPVLLAHRLHLRMRVPPTAASYAALLDGYARVADPRAAQKLLDEMPGRGLAPSSLARSFLVKAFLRARDVDAAMELVDNHLWPTMAGEEQQEVTNAAFANLVQCLCAEGFFHVVFRIAEEMPQRRCHVADEFAYAQMIDSLCRAGQHHGASRIVYIMRKRGLCPSAVSYNCIVHGLSTSPKPGACLRAHQLVMEGTHFGYCPREVTYKVLVDELCRENELAKAKDVLQLMLQPTIQHGQEEGRHAGDETRTTRIYNVFLRALRAVDNPSEQLGVLVSMLQAGCKPDVITMNTVIHGFCKSRRAQEARRILDDMLTGKFCAPDVVTFTTLMSGHLDAGNHAEALNVLHTLMPRHRCSPTVITYNCVLKGLFGLAQVDAAMQVLEEMNANNVTADSVTHTVVIKGLCDAGQLEKAKEFWDNVVWPSGIHDDYVYSAIFRGLCKQRKLEQACDFLYELVDCGVAPSIVSYNILIDAACKQGLKKLAYQLVKEMKRNGLAPDAVTWRILGKLHHYEEEEQQGHQLPAADVGRRSADDRLKPFVMTKEMPSLPPLSSSKDAFEVDENNNSISETEEEIGYLTDMANNNKAEAEEVGYSTKITVEEQPDDTDPPRRTKIDKGDITWGGVLKKPDNQSLIREPLSKVARKVFGIL